ncbi:MAG: DUF262 domain-containing protein [Alphaproteobacteria bacterium]
MDFTPQHLTLNQLLQGKLFKIPDYQRSYSWKKHQRKDLFGDIKEAHKKDQNHFMATIVGLIRGKQEIHTIEFQEVEIVDGQQRITTLIILLRAIMKKLGANKNQKNIHDEIQKLLIKGDEHSLILLQTNHDSSNIYGNYIKSGKVFEGEPETAADKNIHDAIKECEAFVKECEGLGIATTTLLSTINNKMSMLYHPIKEEAIVYKVFEALNSRGLAVRWLDKTKSRLLAKIYENEQKDSHGDKIHEMKEIWKKIYQCLGLDDKHGDEALRFAGTLCNKIERRSKVLSEQDASNELIDFAGKEFKDIFEAANFLHEVVQKVTKIHRDVRNQIIYKVAHARFLAVVIMLKGLDKAQEAKALKKLEAVNLRIFILSGKDSRTKVGEYIRLGCNILNEGNINYEQILERIEKLGEGHELDEILKNKDVWRGWYLDYTDEARYILYRYEEYLVRKNGGKINENQWKRIWDDNASNTIEHISPQSHDEHYTHDLPNLTLLTAHTNSRLNDKPPQEKTVAYREEGIRITIDIADKIENTQKWDKDNIDVRAKEIEAFVRAEWGDE